MTSLQPKPLYETPWDKPNLKDCYIYHSIELPNQVLHGDWDIRPVAQDYTGNVEFAGKSVLDVGTATGFLSFYAESNGASRVVSVDNDGNHDIIPWCENESTDKIISESLEHTARVKRGYWYCHNALRSKAKVVYSNVYNLPVDLGQFDVVLVGCILLHLRDPFKALEAATKLAGDTIVVVDGFWGPHTESEMTFLPNFAGSGRHEPSDYYSWWFLHPRTITRMLSVLGFSIKSITPFMMGNPKNGGIDQRFYSLVAQRNKST